MNDSLHRCFEYSGYFCNSGELVSDGGLPYRLKPDEELYRVGVERRQLQSVEQVAQFRAHHHRSVVIHLHTNGLYPLSQCERCAPTWLIWDESAYDWLKSDSNA